MYRPLRVSLPIKQDILAILNKFRYYGLVRISQDQMLRQRKYKDLQSEGAKGYDETNKTIHYKNEV